jgi:DMSO/TMAO reductase YedYZ molybdopterin-dependent catalytic subunit
MSLRALAAATFLVCLSVPTFADDASVAIGGQVQHPGPVTVADLQKLPATTVPVSFMTGKGSESATYTGALLWTVISTAAPIDGPRKNAGLRHTYLVTASDGYAVALSEGEIDPNIEGKSVILAYEKDGKPSGIRLIVPGDKHGARAVHDVVKIDVQ